MSGLELMLTRLKFDCDVLILTECWISTSTVIPKLPGYRSSATKNNTKQNDGVVVYFKDHLNFTTQEPQFIDGNCLLMLSDQDTAIISLYRSPSVKNIDTFLVSLNDILLKLSAFKNVLIVGDINIPINFDKIDSSGERYLTLAASHGLLPAHTSITREASGTCLDHILAKSQFPILTIIPDTTLTDHFPVLACMDFKKTRHFATTTITKIDMETVRSAILAIDLSPIYSSSDPAFAVNYLTNNIKAVVDENTSIITLSRRKKIIKPWITHGLLRCMKNRDILHSKSTMSPGNEVLRITYVRYRNYCNVILKKLKRAYEKSLIEEVRNDPKTLWQTIKTITNTAKEKNTPEELLKLCSTPNLSVNNINQYFVDVGRNLAEDCIRLHRKQAPRSVDSSSPANFAHCNSFMMESVSEGEVERLILGLKTESAVGWDKISNKILKHNIDALVHPLTFVFNACLDSGSFPDHLKKSEVRPIYKAGDRNRISNYRPISILPALSKLLEKIINVRLVNYLEKNNLLSNRQFGFRKGKSTEGAVHMLTNYISKNLDKGKKCLSIFLDLSKAFDTISVSILLNKLERIGIRGNQLNLFRSYLTGRKQCVRVGNYTSDDLTVDYGVPQGSVLGPTLFLVYINELTNLELPQGELISYADDTALFFSADSWDEVFGVAQRGYDVVRKWLSDNILTLNVDKTKYITFSIRHLTGVNTNNHHIVSHNCVNRVGCACTSLERVDSIRYLGITIDSHLNFKEHIRHLCARVRKLIYVFKNLRHAADPILLKQIYLVICQSVISYCITCWGGAAKTTIKNLEIAQRAILKIITFKPILYPTTELYQLCRVLTVRQLFIQTTVLKQHVDLTYDPSFASKRRRHAVCTSSHFPKTSFFKRFYLFIGPYVYNKINRIFEIYALNKSNCKKKVHDYLLGLSYDETEDILNIPV